MHCACCAAVLRASVKWIVSGAQRCQVHFREHRFARTVSELVNAVSADMLVSVRLHESCIGGFGYPGTPVSAVLTALLSTPGSGV